jgi:parvulin-like peptidyl-prolyl isomerase
MARFDRLRRAGRPLRRVALGAGMAAVAAGAFWFFRGHFVHRATAQPVPASLPAAAPGVPSDYTSRVVAYVHTNQPVTRQDLGEYLIARLGADKLPLLVNRKLVDHACRQRGIDITPIEIEAALANELKEMRLDQATFVKTVLPRYKKNLYEWKEDVIRPRLQMSRLCADRIQVADEDVRKAFESLYGEKVECRMILWPPGKEKGAMEEYTKLRDNEAAFADQAKKQADTRLAANGGKLLPMGHYSAAPDLEREMFKLRPGEVSTLITTPQGIVLLKCDRRIPADTTVHIDTVKAKLIQEIRDRKLQVEMAATFQALRDQAKPDVQLKKSDRLPPGPMPAPSQPVAYYHGNLTVTREELGEYLIARYGAEKLEFLVNRRILDDACKARGIVVTDEDVDRGLKSDLVTLHVDSAELFEKNLLSKWGKNMFEWREDVVRPKLMLRTLCEGRAKCTEEDLRKAFEAYHGERLECRVILWPHDQAKFAQRDWAKIRDSEREFDLKAKSQASHELASHGGKIPVFGRHTLGDDDVEREAFKLQPGEMSGLIGTPQGQVVIKCDKRIPPDTSVKLEQVRDKLTKEILEKKMQQVMMEVFKDLRDKARPRYLLRVQGQTQDLGAQTKQLMEATAPAVKK